MAQNPNVGAVIVVGLGCETNKAQEVAAAITGKPVAVVIIQECGGTIKAIAAAPNWHVLLASNCLSFNENPVT